MSTTERSAPTPYARARYLPDEQKREGLALCLSGGGFRAALFHLGAVRRLNELGLLRKVDTVSAVSGGTVIAAFLAARCEQWCGRALDAKAWDREIAAPFRTFVSHNLNFHAVLKGWYPWNLRRNAAVAALAARCEALGLTRQTLSTLPSKPEFKFEACDLVSGQPWIFERVDASSHRADMKVATAVSVSSCFPGFFRPYSEKKPQRIALMDGGILDNRAVEPVWQKAKSLLISDGGDILQPQIGESILWSLARSAAVLWNQAQELQKRWLISGFNAKQLDGTYWGIGSSPVHYERQPGVEAFPGYTLELARDVISRIRTDYDAFSDAEAAVLENHGYFLAEAATLAHVDEGTGPPLCAPRRAPLRAPHPAWMNETAIREALRGSSRKRLFGRGWARRSSESLQLSTVGVASAAASPGRPADAPASG